jgi:hypothetical protein
MATSNLPNSPSTENFRTFNGNLINKLCKPGNPLLAERGLLPKSEPPKPAASPTSTPITRTRRGRVLPNSRRPHAEKNRNTQEHSNGSKDLEQSFSGSSR